LRVDPSSSNQSHHADDVLVQDLSDEDAFDVDEVDYSGIDDGFDSGSKFLSSPITCSVKRQEDGSMGGSSATFLDRIVGDSPKVVDVAPLPAVVAPTSVNVTPPMPTIVGVPTASAPPETGISSTHEPVVGKWRDLFASNRSFDCYSKLTHFSGINCSESCTLLSVDLGSNCDVWKSCIVGYVAGKSLGFRALNNSISNTWNCEAALFVHDSGWLIYRFNRVEDKLVVLSGGPYLVFGRPLMLRPMPQFFNFSTKEMSRVLV